MTAKATGPACARWSIGCNAAIRPHDESMSARGIDRCAATIFAVALACDRR
jgi:hypothetical protein